MKTKEFKEFFKKYLETKKILRPLFIEGSPGIGKTEIIRQISKKCGYRCIVTHLGSKTIDHFSGLPEFSKKDNGKLATTWSEPALVDLCNKDDVPTVLFLDDVHLASEIVIKILFEALTERAIHGEPLGNKVKVVGSMNEISSEMGSTISEIPDPVRNRFIRLKIEPDLKDWLAYANKIGVDESIIGFLSFNNKFFCAAPADESSQFPTPRSWVGLSEFFNEGFSPDTPGLVEGAVGKDAAIELLSFYEIFIKFDNEKPKTWDSLSSYKSKIAFIAYLLRKLDVDLVNKYLEDIVKDSAVASFSLELVQKIIKKMSKENDQSEEGRKFKEIITKDDNFKKINFLDI